MTLEKLIENSGDSILKEYKYIAGFLMINIEVPDLNKEFFLKIKTNLISTNDFYLNKEQDLYRTFRIEIIDLSTVLLVDKGFYIPSNIFSKFINEKKLGYNLAYGEKVNSIKYILNLKGYDNLISCIINDLDSISFFEK